MASQIGKVYLVGAGPGDPGLITLRGLECLAVVDCVIYDYLVSRELLSKAKEDAELIFAGKRAGTHTLDQDKINRLMVDRAVAGLRVVRLKGGDPYIFGRGGEEGEYLYDNNIPFEVVPGVSSAISVPSYAGIPLTGRGESSSVAIITGHEASDKGESSIKWDRLATGVETIVILMGLKRLPFIVEKLIEHGLSEDTPVALVRYGSTPEQETVVGTLGDIVAKAHESDLKTPVVIVVGEVVRHRERLNWFERKPLFGLRVLVTRAKGGADQLSAGLKEAGAYPIEFPTIKIVPLEDYADLDRAIEKLSEPPGYDWLVFTSTNGVKFFWERLYELGKDARELKGIKIAAIGPATASSLERHGLRADVVPSEYRAEGLLAALGDVGGCRILLPRAQEGREVLPRELCKAGAEVEVVAAYRTLHPTSDAEELGRMFSVGEVDVITFTSSSTVRNFAALFEDSNIGKMIKDVKIACISPVTADAVRQLGLTADIVAGDHTMDGLVEAIKDCFL